MKVSNGIEIEHLRPKSDMVSVEQSMSGDKSLQKISMDKPVHIFSLFSSRNS